MEFTAEKIYEKNYADTIRMKSQLVNRKFEAIVNGVKKDYSMELTTTGARTYLKQLLNTEVAVFSTPKNMGFLKLLFTLFEDDEFYVLDFFSGSASSADTVMHLNEDQNKKIHFIAIQLAEDLDYKLANATGDVKKTVKNAIDFLDRQNRPHTLDFIGIERIKASALRIKQDNPDTTADLGFKHYTLAEVNQTTLDKIEKFDNSGFITDTTIYDEFGIATVLTTWLVHDNYGFVNNCKMVDLTGYVAYWCDNHLYLINPGLSEEAIKVSC